MFFINKKLKENINNGIRHWISIKQFNRNIIINSKVALYKNLLTRTLLEIFSQSISRRIISVLPEHNKNLIKYLLNQEDDKKRY